MKLRLMKSIVYKIQKTINGLYVSGSYRRNEETINDLDFITKRGLVSVLQDFEKEFVVIKIHSQGHKYLSMDVIIPFWNGHITEMDRQDRTVKIDIWFAGDDYEYFYKKLMHDLDKGHSIYWKKQAKEKGFQLSDLGLKQIIDGKEYLIDIKSKQKLKKILEIK